MESISNTSKVLSILSSDNKFIRNNNFNLLDIANLHHVNLIDLGLITNINNIMNNILPINTILLHVLSVD